MAISHWLLRKQEDSLLLSLRMMESSYRLGLGEGWHSSRIGFVAFKSWLVFILWYLRSRGKQKLLSAWALNVKAFTRKKLRIHKHWSVTLAYSVSGAWVWAAGSSLAQCSVDAFLPLLPARLSLLDGAHSAGLSRHGAWPAGWPLTTRKKGSNPVLIADMMRWSLRRESWVIFRILLPP